MDKKTVRTTSTAAEKFYSNRGVSCVDSIDYVLFHTGYWRQSSITDQKTIRRQHKHASQYVLVWTVKHVYLIVSHYRKTKCIDIPRCFAADTPLTRVVPVTSLLGRSKKTAPWSSATMKFDVRIYYLVSRLDKEQRSQERRAWGEHRLAYSHNSIMATKVIKHIW